MIGPRVVLSPGDMYCLAVHSYNVGSYRYAYYAAASLRRWLESPDGRRRRFDLEKVANVLEIERAAAGRPNETDPLTHT